MKLNPNNTPKPTDEEIFNHFNNIKPYALGEFRYDLVNVGSKQHVVILN